MARMVSGIVTHAERVGSSHGNPIYRVTLATPTEGYDGISRFIVQHDAALNYEIANPEFRDSPHVFELSRSGRIVRSVGRA